MMRFSAVLLLLFGVAIDLNAQTANSGCMTNDLRAYLFCKVTGCSKLPDDGSWFPSLVMSLLEPTSFYCEKEVECGSDVAKLINVAFSTVTNAIVMYDEYNDEGKYIYESPKIVQQSPNNYLTFKISGLNTMKDTDSFEIRRSDDSVYCAFYVQGLKNSEYYNPSEDSFYAVYVGDPNTEYYVLRAYKNTNCYTGEQVQYPACPTPTSMESEATKVARVNAYENFDSLRKYAPHPSKDMEHKRGVKRLTQVTATMTCELGTCTPANSNRRRLNDCNMP
jgi:hypothetical protein